MTGIKLKLFGLRSVFANVRFANVRLETGPDLESLGQAQQVEMITEVIFLFHFISYLILYLLLILYLHI